MTNSCEAICRIYCNPYSHYIFLEFPSLIEIPPPGKISKEILQTQWIILSIPDKKHIWYDFDITQSKCLHLHGSPTRQNSRNTSTYYDLNRNIRPRSQKLLNKASKSSPPMQQPRPHNPLSPNHPLLHLNVRNPLQITKSPNYS